MVRVYWTCNKSVTKFQWNQDILFQGTSLNIVWKKSALNSNSLENQVSYYKKQDLFNLLRTFSEEFMLKHKIMQ
jgi:hypothetical protein